MSEQTIETPGVTSTGHAYSEAAFLDAHFEAARPEYEAMLRSVGLRRGSRVLDAGCGGGVFLPLLSELLGSEGRIDAIDLAPENVARVEGRSATGRYACAVSVRVANMLELPYESDTFDAVWCANVSELLSDDELRRALEEFRRVVRPGGIIALKDMDLTGIQFQPFDPVDLWRSIESVRDQLLPVRGWLRGVELYRWLLECGLHDVEQRTTLIERRPPLRPAEQEYIRSFFVAVAALAMGADLDERRRSALVALADASADSHIMKRPDFYFRESQVVTTGRVAS